MATFEEKLARTAQLVTDRLDVVLGTGLRDGEIARPERLIAAMRHGALNGGKRIRPFLLMQSAALFGADPGNATQAAAALECVHCYSLIHDDLPAMDDDDLRRGRPTVHKAFDEATAILAGDGLLTLAFDLIADPAAHEDAAVRCELASMLARAAGTGGMAGGQMLDLMAENADLGIDEIRRMQSMKTGALIRFAAEAGAVLGGASSQDRDQMARFGTDCGELFQLVDDLLDVTSDAETMGKATAKDANRSKGTLVALLGIEATQKRIGELKDQTIGLLKPLGPAGDTLRQAVHFIAYRKH